MLSSSWAKPGFGNYLIVTRAAYFQISFVCKLKWNRKDTHLPCVTLTVFASLSILYLEFKGLWELVKKFCWYLEPRNSPFNDLIWSDGRIYPIDSNQRS